MKTLENIYPKLQIGDFVLFQEFEDVDNPDYKKPELVVIVGLSVCDMALEVYYIGYNDAVKSIITGPPDIYSFAEWTYFWNILGHWKTMPKFKNLLKARRKAL